ncbi:hypothetical protein TNCV_2435061 [Trichonephila clavipes]|nr:hypothetical protein TNCV_2435061 [Trichonephila clavipes]
MVWRAIAYDSRSTLIVISRPITGRRYVDEYSSTPYDLFLPTMAIAYLKSHKNGETEFPSGCGKGSEKAESYKCYPWPCESGSSGYSGKAFQSEVPRNSVKGTICKFLV